MLSAARDRQTKNQSHLNPEQAITHADSGC
jgi:hypothetical protein